MKLRIVDGSESETHQQTTLISYVINDLVAIDGGALALMPLKAQKSIKHVFVSHCHMDHIATLPLFIDNIYTPGPECVQLHATQETLTDLRRHVFNDRLWPDLERLAQGETNFVTFNEVTPGQEIALSTNLKVKIFPVEHTVPTVGHVIEHQGKSIAIVSDTGPCDAIWKYLDTVSNLVAVFLEISFPDSLDWLAPKTKHLTPASFQAERKKLKREVDWYYTHAKPEFQQTIRTEIAHLGLERCQPAMAAFDYSF